MGKTIRVSGFPYLIAADVIKEFLESYTGKGTIVALEVKPSRQSSRPYARVQFTNIRCAEIIIELATSRLYMLFGMPRIYKKLNDSIYNFHKETPDEQWIRKTDFTSSCIGQSSGYVSSFLME
ncbi:hypothetical protein BUALT_Bualt17G0083200 [Buddleja alternifolia]|uniref:RDR1/2-like RRM domain-containing protein n=1 Tax=Buddleja alternifolia TaxID=168488 RepID=A0AAV6WFF0_9LAMI|nr:hypothetical protein BUALT_Bualt17G0083200 [Buddleja alternifolia]